MNIIYMGTPDFAVPALEKLIESKNNLSLVVSQEDSRRGRGKKYHPTPVKQKAIDFGIEVYQPKNINSQASLEVLKAHKPDLIIVAAYGQILSKDILDLPEHGCINIHASLLPEYRGAAPIHRAIIDGKRETGITIMEMEEGLDTGDILLQKSISIQKEDNVGILHDKLAYLGGELIIDFIDSLKSGRIEKVKQDDQKASYAEKVFKDTGYVNWLDEGEKIYNLVRGVTPWPGAYTVYKGKNLKLGKVDYKKKINNEKVGKVFHVDETGIYLNCLDKTVVLKEIQMPGKRMMSVDEFLKGNSFENNIQLGEE